MNFGLNAKYTLISRIWPLFPTKLLGRNFIHEFYLYQNKNYLIASPMKPVFINYGFLREILICKNALYSKL